MGMDDQDVAGEGSLGNSHWAAARVGNLVGKLPPSHDVSCKAQLDQIQQIVDLETAHTRLVIRVGEIQERLDKLQAPEKAEPECEKCGVKPARYWFGHRRVLCRPCAEGKTQGWQDWHDAALLVGTGAILTAVTALVTRVVCAF